MTVSIAVKTKTTTYTAADASLSEAWFLFWDAISEDTVRTVTVTGDDKLNELFNDYLKATKAKDADRPYAPIKEYMTDHAAQTHKQALDAYSTAEATFRRFRSEADYNELGIAFRALNAAEAELTSLREV